MSCCSSCSSGGSCESGVQDRFVKSFFDKIGLVYLKVLPDKDKTSLVLGIPRLVNTLGLSETFDSNTVHKLSHHTKLGPHWVTSSKPTRQVLLEYILNYGKA